MNRQDTHTGRAHSAVLDTNTVLDMFLFEDAGAAALAKAVSTGQVRWIGTARMREELAGVLQRPRMGRWAPPERAAAVMAVVDRCMAVVPAPPASDAPRCRDAADQVFIDLAWASEAEWLLTRDKALLALARSARSRGVKICTPVHWAAGPLRGSAQASFPCSRPDPRQLFSQRGG